MRDVVRIVRTWHEPLAWFAAAMCALVVVSAAAWIVDDRVIAGAPVWAKSLKFAVSFAIYAVTMAWLMTLIPGRRRFVWWTGAVIVVASTLEVAAIVTQVVRGRRSHFNVETPLDSTIFSAMGGLVSVIYLGTVVVAIVLLRTPLRDAALALAVRLGLFVALGGMSVGFLMLLPSAAQNRALAAGETPALVGAHSVGAADGGPGLPLVGWSTTDGDLRVGHFLGMHALQVMVVVALVLMTARGRRLDDRTRRRIVASTAAVYAAVAGLTVWQALRGQALTSPDAMTLGAAGVVVAAIAVGIAWIVRGRVPTAPATSTSARTSTRAPAAARARSPRATAAMTAYALLAVVGLVGTWYFNLAFAGGGGDGGYLAAWFANPASSSAAIDVIVAALVACVFFVREGARLRWRWSVALIPLTFLVALAFTFPLFLFLRERHLSSTPTDVAVESKDLVSR